MKLLLITLLALCAVTCAFAEEPKTGQEAPKLTALDQDGKEVKLEDLYKKGKTLFFFYPKALTGG